MDRSTEGSSHGKVTRRNALKAGAAGALMLATASIGQAEDRPQKRAKKLAGRIKQSVCPWCFAPMPLETLCRHAAAMGIQSVELVAPKDWPILKKYGLKCAIAGSHSFTEGLCDPAHHNVCIEALQSRIDECAAGGVPSVITFSGVGNGGQERR